jgi:hypothetical protein
MTTDGRARRARWWNSLYWRVGFGFVAFVVALLLVQSAIFIYWVERPGQAGPRHTQLRRAMRLAAAIGAGLERSGRVDAAAMLQAERAEGGSLYVVLADGTATGPGGAVAPDNALRTARLMLRGEAPRTDEELSFGGPATFAPIQAGGRLAGFVVAAPPPASGFLREFTRVLSPSNFLLLLVLTWSGARARTR